MAVSGPGSNGSQGSADTLTGKLSGKSPFLGLRLYVLIGAIGACLIVVSVTVFICLLSNRWSRRRRTLGKQGSSLIPLVSKEIAEIEASDRAKKDRTIDEIEGSAEEKGFGGIVAVKGEKVESEGSDARKQSAESSFSGGSRGSTSSAAVVASPEVQNIGWGQWYGLRELETATGGFAEENVIGEGGYGVVYRGVLSDGSVVAVKNLLNNKGQAEKEFKVEVEAIGKVRHKNLVGLIGYCAEGPQRMLVYEYVDNGNLEQWLHGDVGPTSPLAWDIRMRIAIGTAKGLAYLHEGLEPKVVHRDIKSSNILLDKNWNPKVSDFGLAKLLGSEASYVTTRVMGTFGYVSPEYASTGMLNEGSDVYSFGVLLMEIITGRSPVDYSRPAGEMNLVDWFRGMVASRHGEEVVDPLIEVQPSSRALKRVLLVCLRCIDLDANKRPRMGQIVHMLEADEFPYRAFMQIKLSILSSLRDGGRERAERS
ncbi:probable receptor-like serine/threonine-protein kinase At4g34500 isoform X2 [Malania oleifera]|uniref:probable receptor-like serine/threonine-protein kinase At4g34500 isoform X2 n=1 Tax=Malania oleifera TaxID=397392 RepID=UPI0025AEBCF5|nr:probable receptor-like serine/threonine-protein kinase At4g34500 isoform X2 [Malania oleifera]